MKQVFTGKTVRALFLGYMSSGKSTFLTAAALASDLGKLELGSGRGLVLTERVSDARPSYFRSAIGAGMRSRIDALRRGETVPKTQVDEWHRIELDLEIAGEEPAHCLTQDYAGDLTILQTLDERTHRLVRCIQEETDCLYLMFDASLLKRGQGADFAARELANQATAIAMARRLFEPKQKQGWPVVVVINKADLLLDGSLSNSEREAEIRRLNQDEGYGQTRFRELFGVHADAILRSKAGKPAAVRYVATLGVDPRPLGDQGRYGIRNPDSGDLGEWNPVGLADSLAAGLVASIRRLRRQRVTDTLHRFRYSLAAIAAFALLCATSLLVDHLAVKRLDSLVVRYDEGVIAAETVLAEIEGTRTWWHPSLTWPGKPTALGTVPANAWFDRVEELRRQFTLATFESRAERGLERLESMPVQLETLSSFVEREAAINRLREDWVDLLSEVVGARELFPDPATRRSLLEQQGRTANHLLRFQSIALEALWSAAGDAGIARRDAENKLDAQLARVTEWAEMARDADAYDEELVESNQRAFHRGKCRFLEMVYRRAASANREDMATRFPLLAEAFSGCENEELRSQIRQKLLAEADRWDALEASRLYEVYPRSGSCGALTSSVVDRIDAYATNSALRLQALETDGLPYEGRYDDVVDRFRRWEQSLHGQYQIAAIELELQDSSGFQGIERRTRRAKDGWDEKSVPYDVAVPPSGTFTISFGDQSRLTASYSGYRDTLTVNESIIWEPGASILAELTESTTGQSLRIEDNSRYSLCKVAEEGLGDARLIVRFPDLRLPLLNPTHRDLKQSIGSGR